MDPSSTIQMVLGLLLLSGLLLGLVAARFGLPRVAAYVLAGMLFSPSLLGGLLGVHVKRESEALLLVKRWNRSARRLRAQVFNQ